MIISQKLWLGKIFQKIQIDGELLLKLESSSKFDREMPTNFVLNLNELGRQICLVWRGRAFHGHGIED